MTSKKFVEDFLKQKNIAVAGVSRNSRKFGNFAYRELRKKGYNVLPLNPNTDEIEGNICYPGLKDVPGIPDAVLISLPPSKAMDVVKDAKAKGIKRVWLQQGSQSEEAVKFCEDNGINCVSNECILMFTDPAAFYHRAHKWIRGLAGKLPQ